MSGFSEKNRMVEHGSADVQEMRLRIPVLDTVFDIRLLEGSSSGIGEPLLLLVLYHTPALSERMSFGTHLVRSI